VNRVRDITADIGPRYPSNPAAIPMFAFNEPAVMFWQAVYDGLRSGGANHLEAVAWLQSKHARWLMASDAVDLLVAVGQSAGRKAVAEAKALRKD
jgi:hypothetical protein